MSGRLKFPLSHQTVRKADDQFYASHPEMVQGGKRIPLDATDPAQSTLRKDWISLYLANGGPSDGTTPGRKKPADHTQVCQICSKNQGLLVLTVVDLEGNPIEGALVNADGLQKTTDRQGIADFGAVDAKTYTIGASKGGYVLVGVLSHYDPYDKSVVVTPQQKSTAQLGLTPCIAYRLTKKPLLIAKAAEKLTPPIQTLPVPGSVGGTLWLEFGQDTTHGRYGKPVTGYFLGEDEQHLRAKMVKLLDFFAQDDTDGKAQREFDAFLAKAAPAAGTLTIYTDPKLDKAVAVDENFVTYPDRTLAAPGTKFASPPSARIHQALAAAAWDVNKVATITDLGVPAFNAGDKLPNKTTGDWSNGLAVMMDTVQYVLVFVDQYEYDMCKQQYTITLIFEIYDIFGLDDEDLKKYGATGSFLDTIPQEGITAWWQLQHMYDYAPLITKAVVTRTFTISTQ